MPTYEYLCAHCGHALEAFQRMSDDPLKTCPSCQQETLTKVMLSAPNFQLKGKGWYKTDYAKNTNNKNTDSKNTEATPAAPAVAPTTPKDNA